MANYTFFGDYGEEEQIIKILYKYNKSNIIFNSINSKKIRNLYMLK